eukprot:5364339-Prymnesium_polylepis.1
MCCPSAKREHEHGAPRFRNRRYRGRFRNQSRAGRFQRTAWRFFNNNRHATNSYTIMPSGFGASETAGGLRARDALRGRRFHPTVRRFQGQTHVARIRHVTQQSHSEDTKASGTVALTDVFR